MIDERDVWRYTWAGPAWGRLAARWRLLKRAWFRMWLRECELRLWATYTSARRR